MLQTEVENQCCQHLRPPWLSSAATCARRGPKLSRRWKKRVNEAVGGGIGRSAYSDAESVEVLPIDRF